MLNVGAPVARKPSAHRDSTVIGPIANGMIAISTGSSGSSTLLPRLSQRFTASRTVIVPPCRSSVAANLVSRSDIRHRPAPNGAGRCLALQGLGALAGNLEGSSGAAHVGVDVDVHRIGEVGRL